MGIKLEIEKGIGVGMKIEMGMGMEKAPGMRMIMG
jgi:hypothetical protein